MRIEEHPTIDGHSIVTLDEYADLLTLRTMPDYRWQGYDQSIVETADLADLGLVKSTEQRRIKLADHLFDYQGWIVRRAIERERFALFADTGLGKTAMQLEWARIVTERHGGRTLILAPLSVCPQTVREAQKFYGGAVPVANLTARADLEEWLRTGSGIGITNYEKFDTTAGDFTGDDFGNAKYQQGDQWPVSAVVLDESSMLKGFGSRKFAVIRAFDGCRYKLACSATPAPNQRTEFAQHALFLGQVRSTTEYLTAYFMNRDGDWQFKPHSFDAWIANLTSWAVFLRDPKAWGFADLLADLPPLYEHFPEIALDTVQMEAARLHETGNQPSLFGATPGGITSRTKMMQIAHGFELGTDDSLLTSVKPQWIADLVNGQHADDQVIIWVTFDREGDRLAELIGPDAIHLSGSTKQSVRSTIIEEFGRGDGKRVLILKPAMFGFGVNLQSCHVQVFSTITDSFERYYQCVRRSYRFGQKKPVTIYVPLTQLDQAICQNTMNKQSTFIEDARTLEEAVIARLRPADTSEIKMTDPTPLIERHRTETEQFTLVNADCLAHMPTMAAESIDLAVFSPPFAALYAYSKELGDMGNIRADAEFRLQWRWFADRLLRVMKPGRVVAIHCKEIIRFANTHGYRHCYDFPAELRDGMVDAGFRYQRRVTIWKNPQLEATRNKETSLLHVTAIRNATDSFPQTGEYLMVFTAPGAAPDKVTHTRDEWSFEHHTAVMNSIWQEPDTPDENEEMMWSQWIDPNNTGPVWTGIRETDVLNAAVAKERPEERHVCPLQLSFIRRCVTLWTNPGELVFSPFAGIGSEGWESIAASRRFYGCELKESYYRTAARNLKQRESEISGRMSLFDDAA